MFDFLRWITLKSDAPPGSLVFAGETKAFTPSVVIRSYDERRVAEREWTADTALDLEPGMNHLVHVAGVHDADLIRNVGEALSFPVLALEDVMNTGQRPKFTWTDDETGFLVLKSVDVEDMHLESEQVAIFWRDGLVAVFTENESDVLVGICERLNKAKSRMRSRGSAYMLSAVIDAVVDRELMALGKLGELAERLESELLDGTTDDLLGQLYQIKRETILLRNTLLPVGDIFKALQRDEAEFPEDSLPYLRDVAGHNAQALEGSFALHDILKTMIDYQISIIGIRTNSVMQFLTIIATIFIPLTFIAGIYGMNFQYMPELQWKYGYFIALGVMGAVAVGMLGYFIKKKLL